MIISDTPIFSIEKSSHMPTVSVIIPAYNVEAYIDATLDSVTKQIFPFTEIIIVNDGSTDRTLEKIQNHPHAHEFTIITTKNQGVGQARNEGIRRATSDYLYFLDADDYLSIQFTQIVTTVLQQQKRPDLLAFSGHTFVDGLSDKRTITNRVHTSTLHNISGRKAIIHFTQEKTLYAPVYNYISLRSIWETHQLRFKPILHEDDEIYFPLFLSCKRVSIIPDTLHFRRLRPGSITTIQKTKAHSDGFHAVTLSMLKLLHECPKDDRQMQRIIRHKIIRHARRYIRTCYKAKQPVDYASVWQWARELHSPTILASMLKSVLRNHYK